MIVKYKVSYKLMKGKKIVAYKIYAGFYIFFISPVLYEEAVMSGLIDEQVDLSIPERTWFSMTSRRGRVTEYRIKKALELSTLSNLKVCLERVNNEIGLYEVLYYGSGGLYWKIVINTGTLIIESMEKTMLGSEFNWTKESLTYEFILDYLCSHLDRQYMNSRHLWDKLQEVEGYKYSFGPYKSSDRMEVVRLKSKK